MEEDAEEIQRKMNNMFLLFLRAKTTTRVIARNWIVRYRYHLSEWQLNTLLGVKPTMPVEEALQVLLRFTRIFSKKGVIKSSNYRAIRDRFRALLLSVGTTLIDMNLYEIYLRHTELYGDEWHIAQTHMAQLPHDAEQGWYLINADPGYQRYYVN